MHDWQTGGNFKIMLPAGFNAMDLCKPDQPYKTVAETYIGIIIDIFAFLLGPLVRVQFRKKRVASKCLFYFGQINRGRFRQQQFVKVRAADDKNFTGDSAACPYRCIQIIDDHAAVLAVGRIELDDVYWGGERRGGKRGRGSENKTPFVAAVETTAEGQPVRMKMHRVKGFEKTEISRWSRQQLRPDSHVVTDGLRAFKGLEAAEIGHETLVTGGGAKSVELLAFHWVNTLIGNVKNAMHGTYHAIRPKHLPRYLAEFEYRFNRRFKLDALVPRLLYASVQTPPMPGRLLKLAEAYW